MTVEFRRAYRARDLTGIIFGLRKAAFRHVADDTYSVGGTAFATVWNRRSYRCRSALLAGPGVRSAPANVTQRPDMAMEISQFVNDK